jgi:hypothetical protein
VRRREQPRLRGGAPLLRGPTTTSHLPAPAIPRSSARRTARPCLTIELFLTSALTLGLLPPPYLRCTSLDFAQEDGRGRAPPATPMPDCLSHAASLRCLAVAASRIHDAMVSPAVPQVGPAAAASTFHATEKGA